MEATGDVPIVINVGEQATEDRQPRFDNLTLEGCVEQLPPLRPGEVRFCGLTLDKPLAKVLQHCQDDWKDWAKDKREKHLQWRKQVEDLDQQSQQQSSKGSKKGKARAGKKPPSKAPALTAEDNLQMLDDDKKAIKTFLTAGEDLASVLSALDKQITHMLKLTGSPMRDLPEDVPCSEGVEGFAIGMLPDGSLDPSEPRKGLIGRKGLRAKWDLDAWTVVGVYRCMCMPKAVYDSVCRTRRPPAGMLGPEWKVLLESYCLDDREWPQVEFVTERNSQLQYMMSGLAYGNLTALCNDPCMEDPLANPQAAEDAQERQNTRITFINVRGFPVPFMVTIKPVAAGRELTYSYGKHYWELLAETIACAQQFRAQLTDLTSAAAGRTGNSDGGAGGAGDTDGAGAAAGAAGAGGLDGGAVAGRQPAPAPAAVPEEVQQEEAEGEVSVGEPAAASAPESAAAGQQRQQQQQQAPPPAGSMLTGASSGLGGQEASSRLAATWKERALQDYELQVLEYLAGCPNGSKVQKMPRYEALGPDGHLKSLHLVMSQQMFWQTRAQLWQMRGRGTNMVVTLRPGALASRGLAHLEQQQQGQGQGQGQQVGGRGYQGGRGGGGRGRGHWNQPVPHFHQHPQQHQHYQHHGGGHPQQQQQQQQWHAPHVPVVVQGHAAAGSDEEGELADMGQGQVVMHHQQQQQQQQHAPLEAPPSPGTTAPSRAYMQHSGASRKWGSRERSRSRSPRRRYY